MREVRVTPPDGLGQQGGYLTACMSDMQQTLTTVMPSELVKKWWSVRGNTTEPATRDRRSRFSRHNQEKDVEMLPASVLAMAAQAHRRHSAASARWDEGNLMRAMERLGVGTLGWRYGSGA